MSFKERTEKRHRRWHRYVDGKKLKHKAGYYDYIASEILDAINELADSLKEVSKQQKYLWNTLNNLIEERKVK